MRRVTRDAMRDGAFGVASALIYPPGNYAGTHELSEIAKAMAPYHGVYISHIRSEGDSCSRRSTRRSRSDARAACPSRSITSRPRARTRGRRRREMVHKIDSARARRAGCGRDDVSVHRVGERTLGVRPAVGGGEREAARQSEESGDARADHQPRRWTRRRTSPCTARSRGRVRSWSSDCCRRRRSRSTRGGASTRSRRTCTSRGARRWRTSC